MLRIVSGPVVLIIVAIRWPSHVSVDGALVTCNRGLFHTSQPDHSEALGFGCVRMAPWTPVIASMIIAMGSPLFSTEVGHILCKNPRGFTPPNTRYPCVNIKMRKKGVFWNNGRV